MAKVVCATRVGNMKDPNPETRGTVDVLDLPVKDGFVEPDASEVFPEAPCVALSVEEVFFPLESDAVLSATLEPQ